MTAFVIVLEGERFLTHGRGRNPLNSKSRGEDGWRPFRWAADLTDAEKFGSPAGALLFARSALPHERFVIRELATMPGPGRKEIA